MDGVIVREAARIVLLSEDERVLLFRATGPVARPGVRLWITPGGGIDPGESPAEAAIRELWEETGLRITEIGSCIWTREIDFEVGERRFRQREQYFVHRTPAFEPSRENFVEGEDEFLIEHRWWSIPEIGSSTDYFAPRRLAALLPGVFRGVLPASPVDCGP